MGNPLLDALDRERRQNNPLLNALDREESAKRKPAGNQQWAKELEDVTAQIKQAEKDLSGGAYGGGRDPTENASRLGLLMQKRVSIANKIKAGKETKVTAGEVGREIVNTPFRGAVQATLGGVSGALDLVGLDDAAESVRDYTKSVQEKYKAPESAQQSTALRLGGMVGEGLGSTAPYLVGGLGKVGMTAAGVIAGGGGADQQDARVKQARLEGKEVSATQEVAAEWGGAVTGLLELVPIHALLKKVPKGYGNAVISAVSEKLAAKAGGRLAGAALEEGVQESVSGVIQDLIESGIYNEDVEVGQSALQDFALGATVGGIIRGGVETGRTLKDKIQQRRAGTPEQVGTIESASAEAARLSPEDEASPLPNDLLAEGKAGIAANEAASRVDAQLEQSGLPKLKSEIEITDVDGDTVRGTVEDTFDGGFKLKLPEGAVIDYYLEDITDAGDTVREVPPQTAAEIAAVAAERGQAAKAEMEARNAQIAAEAAAAPPLDSGAEQGAAPPPVSLPQQSAVTGDKAIAGFKARTRRAESGGKDSAKNPNSSATGRYQFIEGTFKQTYKRVYGATSAAADEAWANKRNDPAIQEALMDRLTRDNAAALTKSGIAVTEGNLYLAHFAGIGGAAALHRNPGASAESVLGAAVVKANPSLKGKTAGDVIAWAAGKMGGQAPAVGAGAATATAPEEDVWENPYTKALEEYQRKSSETTGQDDGGFVMPETPAPDPNMPDPASVYEQQAKETPETAAEPPFSPAGIGGEPRTTGGLSAAPIDDGANTDLTSPPASSEVGSVLQDQLDNDRIGGGRDSTADGLNSTVKEANGNTMVSYTDEQGARIEVMENSRFSPRPNAVIDFVVPEDARGKGNGKVILDKIFARYGKETISAAASSDPSAALFYKAGLRPTGEPTATLERTLQIRGEDSSVTMVLPEANETQVASGSTQPAGTTETANIPDRANNTPPLGTVPDEQAQAGPPISPIATFESAFNSNPERALAELPDDQLKAIGQRLGVKRLGKGSRNGFVERIASNASADVRRAALEVVQDAAPVEPGQNGDVRDITVTSSNGKRVATKVETVIPAQDTPVGENASGEPLYERQDGSRYRVRADNNGRPDFGGDLAPVETAGTTETVTPPREPIATRAPETEQPTTAVTPTGREVPISGYRVVELGDLIASNTPDGTVNPAYPEERQPRDRTRSFSENQINVIAGEKFNPRLLMRSPKAGDGAMIIDDTGVVESGNGRTLALRRIYAEGGAKPASYRAAIEAEGFDTAGMTAPALVRVRGPMSEEDIESYTNESNTRDTASMSGTEIAAADAKRLPPRLMELYRGGDIDSAGNRDFVRAFVGALVPVNEQANLILADGTIAAPLVKRIEAAMLVRAVGNRPFVEKLVDAPDNNIKSIGKALVDVSGPLSQLLNAIADGSVDKRADISDNIADAVALVDRARREGRPLSEYVDQSDIFSGETINPVTEAVLHLFFNGPRFTKPAGRAIVADRIRFYIDEAGKAAPGGGLFGGEVGIEPSNILARAKEIGQDSHNGQEDLLAPTREPENGADGPRVRADSGDGDVSDGAGALPQSGQESTRESVTTGNADPDESAGSGAPPADTQESAVIPERPQGEPEPTSLSEDVAGSVTDARDNAPLSQPIEDFGEKLEGARKDVWNSYKDKLADAADADLATIPLSKSWPEPDYQKMLDEGADTYVVAAIRAMRDAVPQKPRRYGVKAWVEQVTGLRKTAMAMLDDGGVADNFQKKLSGDFARSLSDLQGAIDLYTEFGHVRSFKGITFGSHHYSLYRGEENVTKWSINQKAKATAYSNWPKELAVGNTRAEVLEKFREALDSGVLDPKKKSDVIRFDIYSYKSKSGFFIGKKIGKTSVDLKRFDTVKEAREFKVSDEGYAELVQALEKFKDIPSERKESNSPRIGINHRNGADVSAEQFSEAFGFRGVQFGNYVEGPRRQNDLNQAYDALMDLAGVIGVPAKALSLNGELGLAFGARGKGGKKPAAAHFEPDTVVINLTKNAGAGSLAHEWWHSLDNYFARIGKGSGFVTDGGLRKEIFNRDGTKAKNAVRPEMIDAFENVMRAIKSTGLRERSRNLDKRRTKAYWSTGLEMSARAFESYTIAKLQDEQFSNDYLANIVSEEAFGIEDGYPYLTAGEISEVRAAFDGFFRTVETKETDQGLALYRVSDGKPAPINEIKDLERDLNERLKKIVGDRVKLRVGLGSEIAGNESVREGFTVDGQYSPSLKVIQVASDAIQGSTFVFDHEVIHALRDLGAFTATDWMILSKSAKKDAKLWASIQKRYPALSEEAQIEEAVADMFAQYQDNNDYFNDKPAAAAVLNAIRKIIEILRAIRDGLKGRGFNVDRRAYHVLDEIRDGSMKENIGKYDTGNAVNKSSDDARFSIAASPTMERRMGPIGSADADVGGMGDDIQTAGFLGAGPSGKKGELADKWQRFRTATQDRFLPLKKAQREIERSFGAKIPDSMDAYRGEELMHGRIAERLDRMASKKIEPLFDAMNEADVSMEEFETYLYARHARERNAQIAKVNEDMPDGGSGMTNTQARAILSRVEKSDKARAMRRLADRVDGIREDTLNAQVSYGLISEDTAAELRETYQYYVPLRGFKEVEGADPEAAARINRSGGGINVRGKESKRAFGRRSEADSPLAYLILQAQEAVVRGETNKVAQEFVELAKSSPDPDFWKPQKVSSGKRINPETGLVEEYLNTQLTAADAPYTVVAKVDGKERRVTLNRENPAALRLADSMRRLTESQLDPVTRTFGSINRWLSAVNTRFNPEFVISNMIRDIQSAVVNIQDVDVTGIATKAAKNYPGALKAAMRGAFDKGEGDWGRWYDEFALAGGKTAFAKIDNVERIKNDIEKQFANAASRSGTNKSSWLKVKRAGKAVIDVVENMNDGVENAVRLAAYRAARESGLSEKQAGSIAKNITVNFNRRGQFGPVINSLYLFYNATVQGNVRMMQAIYHSKKARTAVAGIMVAGLAMEMLNMMLSDDDDDGESFYDKIPAWEKERNIIIMLPGRDEDGFQNFVKFPLAYGLNVFWGIGRTAGEVGRMDGDRWQESAANLAATALGTFNPIGFSFEGRTVQESMISLVMPSPLKPVLDLAQNRDFMGKPIMPEENQYGPNDPDFQRYWPGVGQNWLAVTDSLNKFSGGNEVEAGAISVSPETLEYLASTTFGAAGSFFNRIAKVPHKVASGELSANDIPMARKVLGSKSPYHDRSAFYDRTREVDEAVKVGTDLQDAEMTPELERYIESNRRVLEMQQITKEAKKETRKIRKERRMNDGWLEKGDIDEVTHSENDALLDEIENTIILNYNTEWVKTVYGKEPTIGSE